MTDKQKNTKSKDAKASKAKANAGANGEPQELQDRIGEFLFPHTKDYIFDELSENYLKKNNFFDILSNVPVPIRKDDLTNLTNVKIAHNMAVIIGCDINFKFRDSYVEYIRRSFGTDFAKPLINEGIEAASKNDFDYACILFRAALLIDPKSSDALYCYARACKDSYEIGEGEDYVGRYKAEALESFERLTMDKPDFDMGFYFLGYAYLNMGLYIKAQLTWKDFLALIEGDESEEKKAMREEIEERLADLEEPVLIETGYNCILSNRFADGINILSSYEESERFKNWWPLWYYLGIAYKNIDDVEKAKESFLKVLKLSPSNIEAMTELVEIYKITGEKELEEKYANKIKLVQRNIEEERAEKNKSYS